MTEETPKVENASADQYTWKFLDEQAISNWKQTVESLTSRIVQKDISPSEVFYEIVVCLNDFSSRIPINNLTNLVNTIINTIPNVKERQELSVQFLLIFQACNPKPHLNAFIQAVKIDNQFKRQYLDFSILKNGLFPDFNKCYFSDARVNDYGVVTYSSLHESSEGYSKLAVELISIFYQEDALCKITYFNHVIERLIGHFRLDITRSFLLMLSIFAFHLDENEELILQVIKNSIFTPQHSKTLQLVVVSFLLNSDTKEKIPLELRLITLLIKEGILDFHSIYNSLQPLEFESDANFAIKPIENTELDSLHAQYNDELKENAFKATASALALAAPLVLDDDDDNDDDTGESSKTTRAEEAPVATEKKVSVKEKSQYIAKIKFLKYILQSKMYHEALFILVQHPFLPLIDEEVCNLVNDLANDIITPYYKKIGITGIGKPGPDTCLRLVESFEDLVKFCHQFLCFNGVKVAKDSILFTKLVRILRYQLQTGADRDQILQLYRKFIFPALSFANNASVVNEAFSILLDFYQLETRYNLYGEYQNVIAKNDLEIKQNFDIAEKKTKDILKRLSTANGEVLMRQLTRIAFGNPLAVTSTFVNHIESYSSLSDLIVEASKYFGAFVWDSLTFQLCNKLNSNRQAMQEDGLNYMQWIQNLSSFVGKLAKNRPEQFQLGPILTLITKSLNNGSTDLIILVNEIVGSMSGVQHINNLTSRQIFLLNAETSLQKLVYMVIQDRRAESFASSRKLLDNLVSLDILAELFILLVNLPDKTVDSVQAPLKILNRRCDELNSLIHTFTTMVDESLPTNVFKEKMISLDTLIKRFLVRPVWAFQIWRRHLSRQLKANPDYIDELEAILCAVLPLDWDAVSASFYADFWQLSLYDICYEKISYGEESASIKSKISTLNKKLSLSRKDKDIPKKELQRLEHELSQLHQISVRVRYDATKHENNYQATISRIKNKKDQWFKDVSDEETVSKSTRQILEHCFLPRMVHSPFDAVYCAEFLFLAHSLNTYGFSLVYVLNELFTCNFLQPTLFTSTTLEIENLGIFYLHVLKELNAWREDAKLYDSKALGKEGDSDPLLAGLQVPGGEHLQFEEFRKTLFNWHKSLQKQIIASLDSEQYTTRNNAIIFLKNLLGEFPVVADHSEVLTRKLASIYSSDSREDIKLASNALFVLISSKKASCVQTWEFYEMDPEEKEKLMKKREERLAAERARKAELEMQEREKREAERKEREKATPTARPYGLVGLEKKVKHEKPEQTQAVVENPEETNKNGGTEDKMEGIESEKEQPMEEKPVEEKPKEASEPPKQTETKSKPPSRSPTPAIPLGPQSTTNKASTPTGPSSTSSSALRARLEEEKRLLMQRQASSAASSSPNSSSASPLPPPPLPPPSNPPGHNYKGSRDYRPREFSTHRQPNNSGSQAMPEHEYDRASGRKRRYESQAHEKNKRQHY
ncbi:hypothetical protein KL942_004615 [Ogataea angusta]|uniref:THO complex subunit 2 n=1 Tax=Pichia angusta TaxID=870730 RepID=A0ABQ7RS39_PICAN|nr:hypothetical protein KL942_004615 [Ogataea angusta]KAG7846389.1 hypothetical protein KL940_004341 [Ogataea angusta]